MGELNWELFRKGDKTAWGLIYDQYADVLYSYGIKLANDPELVGDCIQEMFVNLYSKRDSLPSVQNTRAYLITCLKNTIYRAMNKNSKTNRLQQDIDSCLDSFELSIDIQASRDLMDLEQEKLLALQEALDSLTARQREVIYLRYCMNICVEDVAGIMTVSKQTVMNTSYSVLNKLRASLNASSAFVIQLFAMIQFTSI